MEKSMDTQNETIPVKKQNKIKKYLIAVVVLVFVVGAGYGFFKYKQFQNKMESANEALIKNEELVVEVTKYEILKSTLNKEKNRCKDLITQEEGNFAEFSYCQDFLDFTQKIEPQL